MGAVKKEQPKKITLKRKALQPLSGSKSSSTKKTVNVEVRKKRTYVKQPIKEIDVRYDKELLHCLETILGFNKASALGLPLLDEDPASRPEKQKHVSSAPQILMTGSNVVVEEAPKSEITTAIEIASNQREIVRVKNTPAYISVCKSTYHNYRKIGSDYFDESFPAVVAMSRNCKGHYKHELDAWLESKKVPTEVQQGGVA